MGPGVSYSLSIDDTAELVKLTSFQFDSRPMHSFLPYEDVVDVDGSIGHPVSSLKEQNS